MLSKAVSLSMKSRTPFNSVEVLPKFCVAKLCHRYNEKLSFDLIKESKMLELLTTTQVLNRKLLLGSQFRPNPITVFFFKRGGLRFRFARHTYDSFSLPWDQGRQVLLHFDLLTEILHCDLSTTNPKYKKIWLTCLGRTGEGKTVEMGFSAACGIGRMFAHFSLKLVGNGQNQKW